MMAVPTLRVRAGDASCPRRQGRGSPRGMPSRSAESVEPQSQVSLFPRPVGTSPSQCYAAGPGCATHLSLSVCVHACTPAQLPGPSPLQEGGAAWAPHAAFTHVGPPEGRGVEARPDSPACQP